MNNLQHNMKGVRVQRSGRPQAEQIQSIQITGPACKRMVRVKMVAEVDTLLRGGGGGGGGGGEKGKLEVEVEVRRRGDELRGRVASAWGK